MAMALLRSVAVVQMLLLCLLHMELVCCSKSSVRCREIERDILLELKEGFRNQSGRLASWVGNDCCAWQGVHCDNLTGHVTHLNLSISDDDYGNDDLEKVSLKQSLVGLQHLQSLDLSSNNFALSPFPHFLDSFQELRYLDLSYCNFSGPIPQRFGNISTFQYLDLSGNDIHESGGRWLHKLSRLFFIRVLQLSYCGLNFLPQTVLPNYSFAFLSVLDLSGNNFNSTISRWPFTITSLRHLDLSDCNLQGLLPVEIGNLSKLLDLDFSYNSIVITTDPERPGNLCNLRELYVVDNQAVIQLKDLGGLWSRCARNSLEVLDFSSSNFFGKMPDWLWELRNLTYLSLGGNLISGSIPAGIGKLTNLQHLDISDNKLNGTIDKAIGNLSKLEILYLHDNHLNGNLTEFHFSQLVRLKDLWVSRNSLVLDVGSQWQPPFQLQYIGMDGCQVGPLFPLWLQGQKNLTELYMSNSLIRDNLPEWFWSFSTNLKYVVLSNNKIIGKIPNPVSVITDSKISSREDYSSSNSSYSVEVSHTLQITELDLSNNSFFGPLPVDFAQAIPNLNYLDLSMNNFAGRITNTLCDLPQLEILDLSKNGLSGDIPSCWNKTPYLQYVDFGDNNISGGVPCSFCSANSVFSLRFYNNNISGEIPPCLKNCTNLQELDIGNNRLVGNIPGWLGENLLSLTALILRINLFVGRIPPQLSFLNQMNILDLSGNNLSGEIPKSFGNLTRMRFNPNNEFNISRIRTKAYVVFKGLSLYYEYREAQEIVTMDLSSNMLSGEMPIELTKLVGLHNLNFSNNHLGGEITSKIGKLSNLESLDLSRNQLDGPIPDSLSNLSFLSRLNLSYNMLSGRIPTGTQLQSQDPSAYIGNINLCGPPLTNLCEPKSQEPSNSYYDTNRGAEDSIWNLGSMGFGFAVGLLGFCGFILFQSKWSDSYLRFVDKLFDRFFLK